MPTTFYCFDPENDPEGVNHRRYDMTDSRPPDVQARAAAEAFAEDGWAGDEGEVRRVRTHRGNPAGEHEDFLVRVEMVPRFVASKEG